MATLFWGILFTTFIVEDWAIAGSLALVSQGKLSWFWAYMACFIGISVGDILLYFLGRLANVSSRISNYPLIRRIREFVNLPENRRRVGYVIVISRAIPGTRFAAYVSAGLVSYSVWRFLIITPLSVGLWVLIAFAGGRAVMGVFVDHWFFSVVAILFLLGLLRHFVPMVVDPWTRKTIPHFWRRWLVFEFWPAWFAYAPIIPYYVYLSIRYGSVFQPFYANPQILNSGLIGEEKWDFQKRLDPSEPATLHTIKIPKSVPPEEVKVLIKENNFQFPFILKPNVGQRGFAVRIIKNETLLDDYLRSARFDFLVQEKSCYFREAGIFYIRFPGEKRGEIISITDKDFPFVVGDGLTKLGDLVLRDKRARMIATMYFPRLRARLDEVIAKGEKVFLTECGNHSQGAMFIDGQYMRTEALLNRIESLAQRIPDFYFGRFDIRYENPEKLMAGENFEIVEINGAGADITHIYDPRTPVLAAYRVMFMQWSLLFRIGRQARLLHRKEALVDIPAFLKEIVRVNIRKDELSVSS
jgi:membrane protein DedA with SNARE-associated domain